MPTTDQCTPLMTDKIHSFIPYGRPYPLLSLVLISSSSRSCSSRYCHSLQYKHSEINHQPVHTYTQHIYTDKVGYTGPEDRVFRKIQHNMRRGEEKKATPRLCSVGSTVWTRKKHLSNTSTQSVH